MRCLIVASWIVLWPLTSASAQVSIQIGPPNLSIGINIPTYPQLVQVPGCPVYYAPSVASNYFFYDGAYWVFERDNWHVSPWYNGPWSLVPPQAVPVYILRVPVKYYRRPPPNFHGWSRSEPPRWGEHWGKDWQEYRSGWEWNRKSAPPPAPLPAYQKGYAGERYPHQEQQPVVHSEHYQYQPRDATVQQAYQAHGIHGGPPSNGPQHDQGHQGQPKGEGKGKEHGK